MPKESLEEQLKKLQKPSLETQLRDLKREEPKQDTIKNATSSFDSKIDNPKKVSPVYRQIICYVIAPILAVAAFYKGCEIVQRISNQSSNSPTSGGYSINLGESHIDKVNRFQKALEESKGNPTKAAQRLGMSESTFSKEYDRATDRRFGLMDAHDKMLEYWREKGLISESEYHAEKDRRKNLKK